MTLIADLAALWETATGETLPDGLAGQVRLLVTDETEAWARIVDDRAADAHVIDGLLTLHPLESRIGNGPETPPC